MLIGSQLTEDWLLMRFGRVTSTGAPRVFSVTGSGEKRREATDAEVEVSAAALLIRQRRSTFS